MSTSSGKNLTSRAYWGSAGSTTLAIVDSLQGDASWTQDYRSIGGNREQLTTSFLIRKRLRVPPRRKLLFVQIAFSSLSATRDRGLYPPISFFASSHAVRPEKVLSLLPAVSVGYSISSARNQISFPFSWLHNLLWRKYLDGPITVQQIHRIIPRNLIVMHNIPT